MSRRNFSFRRDVQLRVVAIALLSISGVASAYQWDDEPAPPREDTAFRAALAACAAEQGLPPPDAEGKPRKPAKGEAPPKRPDRDKMDACLRGKGFEPPHMRGRGEPPPPPEGEDD
ncbi:hypothetical protein QLQ15_02655 [Lysobacter sp. LF1]|uniref:Uncharacterized protein n=1 Tax=Lysobacter stagni TaxID=3045172 RepID=A0ABT6XCL0_9GAMM|nr:hypothetical protein [Lysobacter sp. LF1]MDI9237811.1 hypothetical protein [Lysobacter sp. LF1]